MENLGCPTCHRDLEPEIFGLTVQSADSLQQHIEGLKSDRELMVKNRDSLTANIRTVMAAGVQVDTQLRDAERGLTTVTSAVGPLREQLAETTAELTGAERESERLSDGAAEIDGLLKTCQRPSPSRAMSRTSGTPSQTLSESISLHLVIAQYMRITATWSCWIRITTFLL